MSEVIEEWVDPAEGLEVGETYKTEDGTWIVEPNGGRRLLIPTQEFYDKMNAVDEELPPRSPLDIIGEQIVEKDIRIMELELQNTYLGHQVVEKDIQILQLETRQSDIGQQIVDLDIRLMEGGL